MKIRKKSWVTPELRILIRRKKEELVLTKCVFVTPPGEAAATGYPGCTCVAYYEATYNHTPSST